MLQLLKKEGKYKEKLFSQKFKNTHTHLYQKKYTLQDLNFFKMRILLKYNKVFAK